MLRRINISIFMAIIIVHICSYCNTVDINSYDSKLGQREKNLNKTFYSPQESNNSFLIDEIQFDNNYWYFGHDIMNSHFDMYKYWKEFLTAKPNRTNPIDPRENCVEFICQDSGYRTIGKKYLYSVFNKAREAFADGSDFHGEAGWKALGLNRNAKPGFGNIFHTMWDEDIAAYAQQKAALCLSGQEENHAVILQDRGPISPDWHTNPKIYPPGSTCDVDIWDNVVEASTYDFYACGSRPAPRKIVYPSYESNVMTTSLGKGKKMLHHTAAFGFGCGLVTRVKDGFVHQHFVCYFCPSATRNHTWYNVPNLPRLGDFCQWCNKSYENVKTTCVDHVHLSLTHGQRFKHLCFTDVVPAVKFVDTSYSRELNCKCEKVPSSWRTTKKNTVTSERVTSTEGILLDAASNKPPTYSTSGRAFTLKERKDKGHEKTNTIPETTPSSTPSRKNDINEDGLVNKDNAKDESRDETTFGGGNAEEGTIKIDTTKLPEDGKNLSTTMGGIEESDLNVTKNTKNIIPDKGQGIASTSVDSITLGSRDYPKDEKEEIRVTSISDFSDIEIPNEDENEPEEEMRTLLVGNDDQYKNMGHPFVTDDGGDDRTLHPAEDNEMNTNIIGVIHDYDHENESVENEQFEKYHLPPDIFVEPDDTHPSDEHMFPIWLTAILAILGLVCSFSTLVHVCKNRIRDITDGDKDGENNNQADSSNEENSDQDDDN